MRYILFTLFFTFSYLISFSQEYVIFNNPNALQHFSKMENNDDIKLWVKANNGVSMSSISSDNKWCPNKNQLIFVVYSCKNLLRVWFQVDEQHKNKSLIQLNSLLSKAAFKKNINDYIVYPVTFQEGSCIKDGEFMAHITSVSKLATDKKETKEGLSIKLENI